MPSNANEYGRFVCPYKHIERVRIRVSDCIFGAFRSRGKLYKNDFECVMKTTVNTETNFSESHDLIEKVGRDIIVMLMPLTHFI